MSNLSVPLPINPPLQPRNLVEHALDLLEQGRRIAMLTLVNIEGSAPYPLGSQMLVDEDGNHRGQITGGCAESALTDQAVQAIQNQHSSTHRYGADSPYFDIQLPCGSGIDVHIDVATRKEDYLAIAKKLKNRQPAELSLAVTDTAGAKPAKQAVQQFTKHYQPNERLLVFGQGPILLALTQLAVETGFEVIAVAQDEMSQKEVQSAGFSALTLQSASDAIFAAADVHCAAVSLFHEHERETEILAKLMATPVFYIGALGSRRTQTTRLASLAKLGFGDSETNRIFGPVGLDINAETPAQIAVSILAQLIAEMPRAKVN